MEFIEEPIRILSSYTKENPMKQIFLAAMKPGGTTKVRYWESTDVGEHTAVTKKMLR